eukprot:TRINITY_DN11998_c0_g1_i2.p1 TRINITY_DN11998_c0_g1~~TRINITY_DN11998_c0_g1_i2.p1  ORF type:complete len:931 (+),score=335.34 TRINITY_DN11998_c0_g1_i2:80-2872(+)
MTQPSPDVEVTQAPGGLTRRGSTVAPPRSPMPTDLTVQVDSSRQQSFRNLKHAGPSPAAGASAGPASTKAQWLAAKEAELQQREAAVSEAEEQMQQLEELRNEAERHANELTLKEASLREKERLHGALEERTHKVTEREEELERWERELEARAGACVVREAELERASEERMRKYETLVRPLAERERLCLEREEELHRKQKETATLCRREEENVQHHKDMLLRREAELRELKRSIFDQRARLERREAELDSVKEEVGEYLRVQKKKNDELYERGRALEWKESESEQRALTLREQAERQQRRGEELVRRAEEQKVYEARLQQQQAEADELRTDLAAKRRRLLAADEEVRVLERQARERCESAAELMQQAEQRLAAADAAEAGLRERAERSAEREQQLAKRERAVSVAEEAAAGQRKRITAAKRELLEWMRQTEWREQQVDANIQSDRSCILGAPPPPGSGAGAGQRGDFGCAPRALVTWQLQQMKDKYLGATARQRKAKEKKEDGPVERKDLFQASLDELKEMEELEATARDAAVRCGRYLSKLRALHKLQEHLPLTAADVVGRPDLTDLDKKVINAFSAEEQMAVRIALEGEVATRQEITFLAKMNSAPLLQRLNSQHDVDVIVEMEEWYRQCRQRLHERYRAVLRKRAAALSDCLELFLTKQSKEKDLFAALDARAGVLAPEFQTMCMREQASIHRKTPESRLRDIAGSHRAQPPASPKRSPSREATRPPSRTVLKPKRLLPLQLALRQARVVEQPPPLDHSYLGLYFQTDEEDRLMDPSRAQPLQAMRPRARQSRAPERRGMARRSKASPAKQQPAAPAPEPALPAPADSTEGGTPSAGSARGSEAPGGDADERPPSRPGSGARQQSHSSSRAGSAASAAARELRRRSSQADSAAPPLPPPQQPPRSPSQGSYSSGPRQSSAASSHADD